MKTKVKIIDYPILKIMSNGLISNPQLGEGRLLPVLIINTLMYEPVLELIQLHKETPPGDTKIVWGRPDTFFKPKTVLLDIAFLKPMQINFAIEFILSEEFSLIDGIIQSRAFLLQAGNPGDKLSSVNLHDSILVEVPKLAFEEKWPSLLEEIVRSKYRKEGFSKKDSRRLADEHIKSMKEVWKIRRPSG